MSASTGQERGWTCIRPYMILYAQASRLVEMDECEAWFGPIGEKLCMLKKAIESEFCPRVPIEFKQSGEAFTSEACEPLMPCGHPWRGVMDALYSKTWESELREWGECWKRVWAKVEPEVVALETCCAAVEGRVRGGGTKKLIADEDSKSKSIQKETSEDARETVILSEEESLANLLVIRDDVCSFLLDPSVISISFGSLPKLARIRLHHFAEACQFLHYSIGPSSRRRFYMTKAKHSIITRSSLDPSLPFFLVPSEKNCLLVENFCFSRYFYFTSILLTRIAHEFATYLDPAWIHCRETRDGKNNYHVTLVSSKTILESPDLHDNPEQLRTLFRALVASIRADWVSHGLGRVVDQEQDLCSYFVVLSWPSAARALEALKLPSMDFHVTIGFKEKDCHHLKKDSATLLNPDELAELSKLHVNEHRHSSKK